MHLVAEESGYAPALALPLVSAARTRGVLLVFAERAELVCAAERRPLLDAVASLVAIAVERLHYSEVVQEVTLSMESERLRSALLSAVSHDLYATVVMKGKADSAAELKVSRLTTIVLGLVAVVLGIAFEKQNIAFMVSLAFAIAASANFPVLLMSVLWKDCTTRGAVVGGFLGLISSVLLTVVSPAVWEATLGNAKGSALFPYQSPALFSMTIGFVGIWLFSILDKSARATQDRAGFLAQQVRSETGIGASGASGH